MSMYFTKHEHEISFLQRNDNGEFEQEYKGYIPKVEEHNSVRSQNEKCRYSLRGIQACRKNVLQEAYKPDHPFHSHGFLPCKRFVDAHLKCITNNNSTTETQEDYNDQIQNFTVQFTNCYFKKLDDISVCHKYLNDVVRHIYRTGEKLNIRF